MIRAIVYDAVGTLVHVRPSVAELYAEIGKRFGSQRDGAAIDERFRAAFAHEDRLDAQAGWRTSEPRERARWQAIVGHVLDDLADPTACFDALFHAFGQPEAWASDPAASEVLTTLQRAGYRQALASNFDRRLHNVLAVMPGASILDPIFVSSEIGVRKPAAEFYWHIAATLMLAPSSIVMVGDDIHNDFEAARAAGMRSILFDPRRRHLDLGQDRIERWAELPERLNHVTCGEEN